MIVGVGVVSGPHEPDLKGVDMAPLSPVVARWELTSRLRVLSAEMTGAMIAEHLGFSPTYWSKIEKYRKILADDKLRKLLELFALSEEEREDLFALRVAATQRGWWSKFPNLFSAEHQR